MQTAFVNDAAVPDNDRRNVRYSGVIDARSGFPHGFGCMVCPDQGWYHYGSFVYGEPWGMGVRVYRRDPAGHDTPVMVAKIWGDDLHRTLPGVSANAAFHVPTMIWDLETGRVEATRWDDTANKLVRSEIGENYASIVFSDPDSELIDAGARVFSITHPRSVCGYQQAYGATSFEDPRNATTTILRASSMRGKMAALVGDVGRRSEDGYVTALRDFFLSERRFQTAPTMMMDVDEAGVVIVDEFSDDGNDIRMSGKLSHDAERVMVFDFETVSNGSEIGPCGSLSREANSYSWGLEEVHSRRKIGLYGDVTIIGREAYPPVQFRAHGFDVSFRMDDAFAHTLASLLD